MVSLAWFRLYRVLTSVIIILGLSLSMLTLTSCGEEESSSPEQTSPDSETPEDDISILDPTKIFMDVAANGWTALMHSDTGIDDECAIVIEDAATAAEKYIDCTLEIQEASVHFRDIDLQINIPPNTCRLMQFNNYWFVNFDTGTGPSSVYVTNYFDTLGNLTGRTCGLGSHGALTCPSSAPGAVNSATNNGLEYWLDVSGGVHCPFNHSDRDSAFPNCCNGDYTYSLRTVTDVAPVAQTETMTTVADVAGSLDGEGVLLQDAAGSVAFWIDVDDSGTAIPGWASAADRAVEVTTIATGDSDSVVATKLAIAIGADSSYLVGPPSGASISIEHTPAGARASAGADGNSAGFGFFIGTAGADATTDTSVSPSTTVNWGDWGEACFGGTAARDSQWPKTDQSIPTSIRYGTWRDGYSAPYTLKSPISLAGNEHSVNTANYYSAGVGQPNSLTLGYRNSLNQMPLGYIRPQEDYEVWCLDEADEIVYSINLKIREWNTRDAFEDFLLGETSDGPDVDGNEGVECEYESPALPAIVQIEELTTVADVAGNLDGEGILLQDEDLDVVAFWIDVDDSGTAIPAWASAADRAVEITTIATGDSANDVATKMAAFITADASYNVTAVTANVVTIEHAQAGRRALGADGNGIGFSLFTSQLGDDNRNYCNDRRDWDDFTTDYPTPYYPFQWLHYPETYE